MDNSNQSYILAIYQKVISSHKIMLYLVISTIMIAIIMMGFLPSVYYVFIGVSETSFLLHSHAVLFLIWMFFYTLQAVLPAFGRLDLHKKLGELGLPLALILTINGLYVTYERFCLRVNNGDFEVANSFLLQPLTDMIVFPILVVMAVYFKKKPDIHKRLMLLATLMLTIAAIIRIPYITFPGLKFLIWISPIVLAMAYDFYKSRLIHPVYVFGLMLFVVLYARMHIILPTDAWQNIANLMIKYVSE